MRAAILRNKAMVVDDIEDLVPDAGQVLVETVACGICGSDLHTVDHAHELVAASAEAGLDTFGFDPDLDLVMGHELSVRVLETGAGVEGIKAGTAMAAMPFLMADGRRAIPGYDNIYPGGYSERLLLDPMALLPVPNGLDPAIAALTEPMAVGLHAVNQSSIEQGRPAIVIGAGPVGLSVIASLAAAGVEPIIASDFSPRRRQMAAQMGAHVVVDPSAAASAREGFDLAVQAWADQRSEDAPPVIFEAVGVPGVIDMAMRGAPAHSELVVVGVCMQTDSFQPMMGILKHLSFRFVLGWSPEEFARSLHQLAEGVIDGGALVTDEVGLDDVPAAFSSLADPEEQVKILVRPNR